MAKSHSREGEAADNNNGCPDKYIPDKRRSRDRTFPHPSVYVKENGAVHCSHMHQEDEFIVYIHRLLAVAEHGFDAIEDKVVHHKNNIKWDNRPENLEVKTQADHASDHFREGQYGNSKLTEEMVNELRRNYDGDRTFEEIAEGYPVGPKPIREAIRGETWQWADAEPTEGNRRLTPTEVRAIRHRYEPYVVTAEELAEEYGVSKTTVREIANGETWTDV